MNRNKNAKNPSPKRGNQKQNRRQNTGGRNSVNTNNGKGMRRFTQMLNAPQIAEINVNRFWEVLKATTPGGMRVKAREPLGSVTLVSASTGAYQNVYLSFANLSLPLYPGSFPGRIAYLGEAYSQFIFHRVKIELIPNQPTTAAGQLAFYADYSGEDTEATSLTEVLSNISSVIFPVYSAGSLEVTKSLSRLQRYFTASTEAANINQYSQATLFGAVAGFTGAAGAALGELMVEYDVEFFTPAVPALVGSVHGKNMVNLRKEIAHIRRICDCEECTSHLDAIDSLLGRSTMRSIDLPQVTECKEIRASDKTHEHLHLLKPVEKKLTRCQSGKD